MVAPCGFESITTSPLVSMSGSTGGGVAAGGGGAGAAGATGAGGVPAGGGAAPVAGGVPGASGAGVPGAGGVAAAGGAGGGASSLPITSSRSRTCAASLALGSSLRYRSKYSLAFSSCFPFSYETATLNKKAGYGFRLYASRNLAAAASYSPRTKKVCAVSNDSLASFSALSGVASSAARAETQIPNETAAASSVAAHRERTFVIGERLEGRWPALSRGMGPWPGAAPSAFHHRGRR